MCSVEQKTKKTGIFKLQYTTFKVEYSQGNYSKATVAKKELFSYFEVYKKVTDIWSNSDLYRHWYIFHTDTKGSTELKTQSLLNKFRVYWTV